MMRTFDVVAAIIERNGKTLLAQRSLHADQSGMWEFADGKVEPGESQPEASIHELREELGIEAVVGRYIASHQREVSGRLIYLRAWHVPSYQRGLRAHEHQDIVWCPSEKVLRHSLAPADIPLLEALIFSHAIRPADSC